ncbi:hypothetical protein JCM11491_005220, partial [Sporobolomyces phaffii]
IDLRNGYHELRICKSHTRYGHNKYQVMPFGLTHAPTSFHSLVDDTVRPLLDQFVVAYLDGILDYSELLEEHEDHVRQVLAKMREAKLFAKAEKCSFRSDSVEYLGRIIGRNNASMEDSKVLAHPDLARVDPELPQLELLNLDKSSSSAGSSDNDIDPKTSSLFSSHDSADECRSAFAQYRTDAWAGFEWRTRMIDRKIIGLAPDECPYGKRPRNESAAHKVSSSLS